MRRLNLRAILTLCATMALTGAAHADVLEKVPAGAWTVLKVNHLGQTNAKFGKLAETLGWTFMEPALADPLGRLKKEMRITAGLDEEGDLAIIQLDPQGRRPDRSVLTLIPTKDYKALIGGLAGATADGDVTVYRRGGMTLYLADWGGYAAASPTKEIVAAAPTETLKLAARTQQKWNDSDVCLLANTNALREPLMAALESSRAEATTEAPKELAEKVSVDPKYLPAINTGIERLFAIGEAFLRDADGAVLSWTLSNEGVSHSVMAEFKPDSYLRQTANLLKKTDAPLLNSLPGESFLVTGGAVNSPEAISKLIDDIAGPVLEKLPADDELSTRVRSCVSDSKALLSQVKSVRTLFADAGGAMQAAVMDVESDTFLKDLHAYSEKYQSLGADMGKSVSQSDWVQTTTRDAKVIDGVNFDRISFELKGEGELDKFRRDRLIEQFGTDKIEHYVGMVDKKVVGFWNANDDVVSSLIAAVKGGDEAIAKLESVKQVSNVLPKPRIAELFISGEAIFRGVARVVPIVTGMPPLRLEDLSTQFPADLQPLGFAVSGQDGTIEIDTFVPTPLMQALMTAALQQFGGQVLNGGI